MRRAVLVIAFSDHARDPRVARQIARLAGTHQVTAAGLGPSGTEGVEHVSLRWPAPPPARQGLEAALFHLARVRNVPRRAGRIARSVGALAGPRIARAALHEQRYWSHLLVQDAKRKLAGRRFDLVIANDLETLPLAFHLAGTAPVVFDAHEYAPREYDNSRLFRLVERPFREYLCQRYLPRVAGMTTVCEGIAEEYERLTGVRARVVLNAPGYSQRAPRPTAASGPVRIIHHGLAARVRRIDGMIRMMKSLDSRFTLDLMLVESEPGYMEDLRRLAAGDPRIVFRAPVPMQEIVETCAAYDIGLFLLPPTNFNYLHALPNKFFEFVQARLAVAVGPSPEMAALVTRYGMGVMASDFEPATLAAALSRLDAATLDEYKARANVAAAELNAEAAGKVFDEVIDGAVGTGTRGG